MHDAKVAKAKQLTQDFARRKAAALAQVTELLGSNGRTMDDLLAIALIKRIGHNEEINYLTAIER